MDPEFHSLRELYARIEPALNTKRAEMVRAGYRYIKSEDIWNYLKEEKWKKTDGLSLAQMVSDILNTDSVVIDAHFKKSLAKQTRSAYFDEE